MIRVSSVHTTPSLLSLSHKYMERYEEVRNQTSKLVEMLTPDDQMVQSIPEASPTKWHMAHTTWFFETFILKSYIQDYIPFDARFSFLFNSYYKRLGGHPDRTVRSTFSRPTLDEIRDYRAYVDKSVRNLFDHKVSTEILQLFELGLNHEQQHQELIVTDIKHAFWSNPLRPAYQPNRIQVIESAAPPLAWHCFDEGIYEIGHDLRGFAFDNESPRHFTYIKPFSIASRLITNREYLAFMADGGYTRPELWLSDAWDHVCANNWFAPLYWEQAGEEWTQFTCRGTLPLNSGEPVCHVSFYEADAFARWAGGRLPTEFEWEVAADLANISGNFLEDGNYHPRPAGTWTYLQQLFGDTWEWTASSYSAYPGYCAPAGIVGEYNGKFMCNQMVLRGGSCVTPVSHMRKCYRNYFPPHMRWQFSGIRLAHDGEAGDGAHHDRA